MIDYRDFAPEVIKEARLFKGAVYETFDDALAAANAWVRSESVRVISIETVVLPNMWREDGTTDADLATYQGHASWHQFIRVWHERD